MKNNYLAYSSAAVRQNAATKKIDKRIFFSIVSNAIRDRIAMAKREAFFMKTIQCGHIELIASYVAY